METSRQFHMKWSKEELLKEQPAPIPINYNFEKIIHSEYGEFIVRHLVGDDKNSVDALQEIFDEPQI